ncbi:MAG: Uncharacterised protein [SAR116 cluster bacterium]|nr:MAG: Uncharacterised protein [SAR116 cluster bacterium]
MFIFDLTDDFLDQILNGDQPVDTAKFVNNQCQMSPPQPHFMQQVQQSDRRRHKQRRTEQRAYIGRVPFLQMGKDILDVDDAGNIIQRVAAHRQTAVIGSRHLFDNLGKAFGHANRHNIGARDHHIGRIQVAQPQKIA